MSQKHHIRRVVKEIISTRVTVIIAFRHTDKMFNKIFMRYIRTTLELLSLAWPTRLRHESNGGLQKLNMKCWGTERHRTATLDLPTLEGRKEDISTFFVSKSNNVNNWQFFERGKTDHQRTGNYNESGNI